MKDKTYENEGEKIETVVAIFRIKKEKVGAVQSL